MILRQAERSAFLHPKFNPNTGNRYKSVGGESMGFYETIVATVVSYIICCYIKEHFDKK